MPVLIPQDTTDLTEVPGTLAPWDILGGRSVGNIVVPYHLREEVAGVEYDWRRAEIMGGPLARAVDAVRRIITRARDAKAPAPPATVVDAREEIKAGPVDEMFELLDQTVVGAVPVASTLYRHFAGAAEPVYARLDDREGYARFRAEQSAEMSELRAHVAEIDRLLQAHISDGHGGQAVRGYLDDLSRVERAEDARRRVPLSLPPECDGTYDCWRDGDVVCCSLALPGGRIATGATTVQRHVDDVVGYARASGADVAELLGVLPTLACMLAGGTIASRVAGAARPLLERAPPFVGRISPASPPKPGIAALVALCWCAAGGNAQCAAEWRDLAAAAAEHPALAAAMVRARTIVEQGGAA